MNGQERLQAVHRRKAHDRAPLTTLVDGISRAGMDRELREMTALEFYKHIGYDVYQFGNYGLGASEAVKYPYRMIRKNCAERYYDEGGGYARYEFETPRGVLTASAYRGHPVKYPVENLDDLKVLTALWWDTEYIADLEGCEESCASVDKLLEGCGIYVPAVGPSALQKLLEEDVGPENFYYMLQDYPREVTELIELIHDKRCMEYRLIAEHMPYDSCVTIENTSTTYISPAIYRQFSQRHMKDFADIMHSRGKLGILHMCGLLNELLEDLIPTGLDGIHALTEPPIGDTRVERALDVLGEDLIVITCIDATKLVCPDYSARELEAHLDSFVSERLKRANVVFWLPVDGIDTPLDRYTTAGAWFEKNGYPK